MNRLAVLVLVIPLSSAVNWEVLTYRGIPPNVAHFETAGLRIDVDRSAGPIVYRLTEVRQVRGIRAEGSAVGQLRTTAARQGQKGEDDYVLRVGLVEVGSRRPGWLERRMAPAWARRLFDLAPPGLGIAGIRFFNVGLAPDQMGRSRQHPASDLIVERVVAVPDATGRFALVVDLDAPVRTVAVWISADGDDTQSRFRLTVTRLDLLLQESDGGQ